MLAFSYQAECLRFGSVLRRPLAKVQNYCRLPTPDSRLPAPYSLLPTP
ncbi:hypothetical protein [Moorena sp. SIO2C4]|uniref:Uncharacterized protein n=1 Tax=Moorena producens (strain JHB) TaxID=1454205 RepID=A0A9Q9SRZ3_MOOP1|nr:hypothetical protein [Moorena sp. SIO2C4]NES42629.1 hypothetical protein [Moorena sp. SIO2C4]WAN68574.1 hypothetical protein BJP36_40065 [Moorena producens JHB]